MKVTTVIGIFKIKIESFKEIKYKAEMKIRLELNDTQCVLNYRHNMKMKVKLYSRGITKPKSNIRH